MEFLHRSVIHKDLGEKLSIIVSNEPKNQIYSNLYCELNMN
jgi:hypothetical protein